MPYGCEITAIAQEGLKTYTCKLYKIMKVIVQEGLITCILVQEGLPIVTLSNKLLNYVK